MNVSLCATSSRHYRVQHRFIIKCPQRFLNKKKKIIINKYFLIFHIQTRYQWVIDFVNENEFVHLLLLWSLQRQRNWTTDIGQANGAFSK